MKRLSCIYGDEVIEVSEQDFDKIIEFQKPIEDYGKFAELLMTADNGKPIICNSNYDWEGMKENYPEFIDAIEIIKSNGFSTILNFEAVLESKVKVKRCLLLQMQTFIEI